MAGFLLITFGLALGGCATTAQPPATAIPGSAAMPVADVPELDSRALLLLVSDRRAFEPVALQSAIDAADPDVRRQAALAAGRVGDRRSAAMLDLLLGDPKEEVRRAAAFALGELDAEGDTQIAEILLGVVDDSDRETGRLAVEALAKLGLTLGAVVERLIQGPPEEFEPRLLPSLFRFRQGADAAQSAVVARWAVQGLDNPDPRLHAMAAYALARDPMPESTSRLRELLADADPWVRGWAARALGSLANTDNTGIGQGDLDLLRLLLDDPMPGPTIQAIRAVRRILATGAAAPPESWRPRLLELLADERPGVRLTAIEASADWLLDENLGAALEILALSGLPRERELALLALAEGEDPRASLLLLRLAEDPDPVIRAAAATAAGLYRASEILERLREDPEPRVRIAALDVQLLDAPEIAAEQARIALGDPDPAVRSHVLQWAAREPIVPMEAIQAAMTTPTRERLPDLRISGVDALAARAQAEPLERGAIYAELERLAQGSPYLVRRQAIEALERLELDAPALGARREPKTVGAYREIVQRTARSRTVDLVTERGTIRLELACPEAPLTCLSFLQLSAQGFYEGLSFHRVVPDFVIQGGDPRGDGWGGPGYTLRDEPNLLRYERGVLGMARSGLDTAGSQFFIALTPQPHLDGAYTAFGRVVAGDATLETIVQGDKILQILETSAP